MGTLRKHIPFVKSQVDFHLRQVERFASDERRSQLHAKTADSFQELLECMENLDAPQPASHSSGSGLSLSPAELQGLPDELIDELNITESDKLDFDIVELIEQQGGVASLDRILVDIYRLKGEIQKRHKLNSRLYRMVQKGLIHSVPGKKGVYSTQSLSE